ncbi:hypothetical protein [Arthrobacter sp. CDRTa11]|uniref:hypothetical protein n=1 Tax=Arthrobacter sp. CDRTa11 TaxID=2651199 RepID=UPI002265E8D3|nr:hypothetical protein [Arthrobacter sp. CDRTa11]
MVYDAARFQRDDEMTAWHRASVAAGDKRILMRTRKGELYSYAADEIGFARGSGVQFTTWWGMLIGASMMLGIGLIVIWGVLILPAVLGGEPHWGGLFLVLLSAGGCWLFLHYAVAEYRARQLRRARGVPEPGSR